MAVKILISDPLAEEGVKILEKQKGFKVDVKTKLSPDELRKIIPEYDALIVRSQTKVTEDIIKAAGKLKIIARAGVGLDNVDLETAKSKNIEVINAPESLTISVAEHTIGLMLAIARHIPRADKSTKEGKWEKKN